MEADPLNRLTLRIKVSGVDSMVANNMFLKSNSLSFEPCPLRLYNLKASDRSMARTIFSALTLSSFDTTSSGAEDLACFAGIMISGWIACNLVNCGMGALFFFMTTCLAGGDAGGGTSLVEGINLTGPDGALWILFL